MQQKAFSNKKFVQVQQAAKRTGFKKNVVKQKPKAIDAAINKVSNRIMIKPQLLDAVVQDSQDFQDAPIATRFHRQYLQEAQDLDSTSMAVILAGGQEIHALARSGILPSFPMGPNQKVCDVSVAQLLKAGVNKIHVMTQFNSQPLNKHLTTRYPPQFFGVQGGYLEYNQACQTSDGATWYKGSADALRRSLGIILSRMDDIDLPRDIIVCSAKQLHDVDFTKLVGAHRQHDADVTIASIDVSTIKAASMGILTTDPTCGAVVGLTEKPGIQAAVHLAHRSAAQEPHLQQPQRAALVHASAGIYVFNTRSLQKLLEDNPDAMNMAQDLLQVAIADKSLHVHAYEHDGKFTDLTTLRCYHQACLNHLDEDLEDQATRFMGCGHNAQVAPPSLLRQTVVDSAVFGHGCILDHAILTNCVLGPNTFVGKGSKIINSVIMGASGVQPMATREQVRLDGYLQQEIGEDVEIRNAVLDYDVVVGSGTKLLNKSNVWEADLVDEFGLRISEGLFVASRGASIPAQTYI